MYHLFYQKRFHHAAYPSSGFISFLILCTLRFIILSLRFLFYLAVLYLLSVFLTSNMSCIGITFDDNASRIASDILTTLGHF